MPSLPSPFMFACFESSPVTFKAWDPEKAKRERYVKFNAYLPPMSRTRSYDLQHKKLKCKKDIHISSVGTLVCVPKQVNFDNITYICGQSDKGLQKPFVKILKRSCMKIKKFE